MGHYVSGPSTLVLDDGQVIPPGTAFETVFRPEQEAQLVACGAITIAPSPSAVVEYVARVGGVDSSFAETAGEPGLKE